MENMITLLLQFFAQLYLILLVGNFLQKHVRLFKAHDNLGDILIS